MAKFVIFDRDGTLIESAMPGTWITCIPQVRIKPDAAKALYWLYRNGFIKAIATNQRCIGQGMLSEDGYQEINSHVYRGLHEKMDFLFCRDHKHYSCRSDEMYAFEGSYYCPHGKDDNCECRKPKPGLILQACEDAGIDPKDAYMVGDSASDIKAGNDAGCFTIYLANSIYRYVEAGPYYPDGSRYPENLFHSPTWGGESWVPNMTCDNILQAATFILKRENCF